MVPARAARAFVGIIAIILTTVEFLPLIRGRGIYELSFLATHLGAALSITFVMFGPWRRRETEASIPVVDFLLALLSLICAGYFVSQGLRVLERIEGVDPVYPADMVFGIGLILLLLEACRRATGIVLASLAVLFIAYIFLGPYLPGGLEHRGMRFDRFIDLQVLSTQAIFGTPISASANMVFYFLVVGAFLERSGAGKMFVDLAYCLTGRAWGGAGKASVLSSGLFGIK